MAASKLTVGKALVGVVLTLIVLTMFVPIVNLFAKAFSDPLQVHLMKGYDLLPKGFSLIHFEVVLRNDIVGRALLNSLFITVTGTVLSLLSTTISAYVLTRRNLVGKGPLMVCLIVFMILEPGIVPEYMVVKHLHLMDNLWSMVLYHTINVYYLIIMMRFMEEIPDSLIEAAKIDGAGHMTIFSRIVLPLSKVPLLTIGMFYAVVRWNEFFKSSIYLSSRDHTVLQVLLRQFIVDNDSTALVSAMSLLKNDSIARLDFSALKAATIVIAMVPILLLYPVILRYYTGGVMEGGVKE
jgi:putative aldouronate transport system permease protein